MKPSFSKVLLTTINRSRESPAAFVTNIINTHKSLRWLEPPTPSFRKISIARTLIVSFTEIPVMHELVDRGSV